MVHGNSGAVLHAAWHKLLLPRRVTTRLHQYTAGRLKHAGVTDRSSFAAGPRSTSTSPDRLAAAAPLNPDFYRRQNRLLQKRAELAASKRRSDEDDLTECTCELLRIARDGGF